MFRIRTLPLAAVAFVALPASGFSQQFKVEKWNLGGEGGHDYITADAVTGQVFVSRGTQVMVVDGLTGKRLGTVENTPRVHGTAIAPKLKRGFTSNAGDSTVTVFDYETLVELQRIKVEVGGLDGIAFDEASGQLLLSNHSTPGSVVTIDAATGEVSGTAMLDDNSPEGAVTDGKGRLFINLRGKNAIQVLKLSSMTTEAVWPLAPCVAPSGIAYDKKSNRLFVGCSKTSVAVDAKSGKVVAQFTNGDGVDAIAWDPTDRLLYIPAGVSGDVTIVRQDSPDAYTTVTTVATMTGARTIALNPLTHRAYVVALEHGGVQATAVSQSTGTAAMPGAVTGAWCFAIVHDK